MKLPADVDHNVPAVIVNVGTLPYQAVLLRTRQNFGVAEWMSQADEAMAVDFLRLTEKFKFGAHATTKGQEKGAPSGGTM
jgi:hypothetical protein